MIGIGSPVRPSPSPKRKGRRSPTPPSKRTNVIAQPDEQPFRPTPLTPVAWDVSAAQTAGTAHPSEEAQLAAIKAWDPEHPNNPHTVLRKAIAKERQEERKKTKGRGKGGQEPQPDPKAKAQAKGRGRGKGSGKRKGNNRFNTRIVKLNPSKDKGRGKGKKI